MTDDCKERNHPMKLRNMKIITLSKKKHPDDDSSISSSIVDNDSIDNNNDEENTLSDISYNKLVSTIAKLYPSKYNSCKTKKFNKRRISNNFIAIKNNKSPDEYTTWCTCTGSKVCSYYSEKTNNKTFIDFISFLESLNEEEAIHLLKLQKHKTPGIE